MLSAARATRYVCSPFGPHLSARRARATHSSLADKTDVRRFPHADDELTKVALPHRTPRSAAPPRERGTTGREPAARARYGAPDRAPQEGMVPRGGGAIEPHGVLDARSWLGKPRLLVGRDV